MPGYQPKQIEPKWQSFGSIRRSSRRLIPPTSRSITSSTCSLSQRLGTACGPSRRIHRDRHPRPIQTHAGFNVLHPMGWDAFGLPAEQYAVETNTHPANTTKKNIDTFRKQIQMLGFSYDWDREVNTTDPKYYRWTQWIFLQLYNTCMILPRRKVGRSANCRFPTRSSSKVLTRSRVIRTITA